MTLTIRDSAGLDGASARAVSLGPGSRLSLAGVRGPAMAYLAASVRRASKRPVLAVLPDEASARRFHEDLGFFLGDEVFFYPPTELLPLEPMAAHAEIVSKRIEFLAGLAEGKWPVAVTTVENLLERVVDGRTLVRRAVRLAKGEEYERDRLIKDLLLSGYRRVPMVESRGEMSVRGGIVDVFPTALDLPLRVEFFDDEVESMRFFDPDSQRSVKRVDEARILPASMTEAGEEEFRKAAGAVLERADELDLERGRYEALVEDLRERQDPGLLDMLSPLFRNDLTGLVDQLGGDTIVVMPEGAVTEAARAFKERVGSAAERLREKKKFFIRPEEAYMDSGALERSLERFSMVETGGPVPGSITVDVRSNLDIVQDFSIARKTGEVTLKPLAERIHSWRGAGSSVYITAHNRGQAERTRELLNGYGLNAPVIEGTGVTEGRRGLFIALGTLSAGFRAENEGLVVISEEEIFGERLQARTPSRKAGAFLQELQEFREGDYIVHAHHGIGLYRGLKRIEVEGVANDFLLLEYAGGDRLYLPVWRMDLVNKYRAFEGAAPGLDRLGSQGWNRTKKRVKKAIERMAAELLKLYATRKAASGHAFSPPDALFREFEASFEYSETPDQARAIEECLRDMTEPRPMDRLVCGDVGYGKTEVALRAAFKAVLDSKQVAVVVPTTVLAQQHFITFRRRLSAWPVVIEVLSRFRSAAEQKKTLEGIASGRVDIVIGTHRLLQRDVRFKDLGLLVIDEEHRFGVRHKERLKAMKKDVDVLTLTATPIPRTLHMSLAGIRDLSIISTPPEDRLAVYTEMTAFDEDRIRGAIEREMKRGGQVFFVHNRIQSIAQVEDLLKKIVPEAKVTIVHGQMKEKEMEERMLGFIRGEYDVLLSTAIIESGLDIPRANTIIINRADLFGLAELYQLRGRVGRSSTRAYAYFIVPGGDRLTEEARRRLEVLRELTEPGSGFKVAAYDLELRGAGELFGTSQSGRIAEVGLDMYSRLLEETVAEMKGEERVEEVEPDINLGISRYIPEDYIPEMRQRLGVYKKLASASTFDAVHSVEEELTDLYGPLPEYVKNLLETMRLKVLMKRAGATELDRKGRRLYINFPDGGAGESVVKRALKLVSLEPKRFRITPEGRFVALMKGDDPLEEARYLLKELLAEC